MDDTTPDIQPEINPDNQEVSEVAPLEEEIAQRVQEILQGNSHEEDVECGTMSDIVPINIQGKSYNLKRPNPNGTANFQHETQVLRFLQQKGIPGVPKIVHEIPQENGGLGIVQERIPGKVLRDKEDDENIDFSPTFSSLSQLYKIESADGSWGKPKNNKLDTGKYPNFEEYIFRKFIPKIQEAKFLDEEKKKILEAGIISLMKKVNIADRKPVMIHRDLHPWNLIIDSDGHVRPIDFGSARYSLPEEDFAKLLRYETTRPFVQQIMETMEHEMNTKFDKNLLDLFTLCLSIGYFRRTEETPERLALWEMVENILRETNSTSENTSPPE